MRAIAQPVRRPTCCGSRRSSGRSSTTTASSSRVRAARCQPLRLARDARRAVPRPPERRAPARRSAAVRGVDVAGTVEAVGANVTRLSPATRCSAGVAGARSPSTSAPARTRACRSRPPLVRAGRRDPDCRLHRAPGPARRRAPPGRAARADQRRGRRRRHVRRADREGARRRGDRRLQHAERRPRPLARRRPRRRLHGGRLRARRAALRRGLRPRRQPLAARPAPRADARREPSCSAAAGRQVARADRCSRCAGWLVSKFVGQRLRMFLAKLDRDDLLSCATSSQTGSSRRSSTGRTR